MNDIFRIDEGNLAEALAGYEEHRIVATPYERAGELTDALTGLLLGAGTVVSPPDAVLNIIDSNDDYEDGFVLVVHGAGPMSLGDGSLGAGLTTGWQSAQDVFRRTDDGWDLGRESLAIAVQSVLDEANTLLPILRKLQASLGNDATTHRPGQPA